MFAGLTLLMFMTRRQESMLILFGSAVIATLITQLFTKYDSKGLKEFEDADAQKAMYELAQTMDSSKPVYILCYSGNKCAKTAIAVMKDAGFDTNKLFIIKDGAKDKDVAAALVTE